MKKIIIKHNRKARRGDTLCSAWGYLTKDGKSVTKEIIIHEYKKKR